MTTIILLIVTVASQGTTSRPDPAGPDRDPEHHPGQVPRAGHLSQDRAHPPGARADRPPGGGCVGRDRRAVRGDPCGRLRPGRDPRSRSRAGCRTGPPCAGCERDRPGLARPARAVQLASAGLACASRRCHRRRCPGADRRDPARPGGRPGGDTHAARRLPSATRLAAGSRGPGLSARGDHRGHRHHRPDSLVTCRIGQRDGRQRDERCQRPSTRTPTAKPASWSRFVQALGNGTIGAIFSAVSNLAGIAVIALLVDPPDLLLHARRADVLEELPRAGRTGSSIAHRGGRAARVQRARRVHGRDRRHLALRGGDAVADHDDPRDPATPCHSRCLPCSVGSSRTSGR